MFVDLDWPLNASSLLSASAELLVDFVIRHHSDFFKSHSTPLQNSKWILSSGDVKYTGVGQCAIFDRNIRISQKRHDIGSQLLWITNRKSSATDRYVSVPMTLNDLDRLDESGPPKGTSPKIETSYIRSRGMTDTAALINRSVRLVIAHWQSSTFWLNPCIN